MATDTTQAGAPGSCVGADGGAIGMPQLCIDWFPNQIFWLIVALGVIYLILSRVALPRIEAVLAERQGTIMNDIAAAEDLKMRARDAEAAYNKALSDARTEAQRIIGEAKAEIQAGLDEATARADAEIAARVVESERLIAEIRDSAMENVKAVADDVAQDLVAALGGKADAKTMSAAVTAEMKGQGA